MNRIMSPLVLLWILTGCAMLQPLSTDVYLASLPHLKEYFAATPAQVQQTLSLFVLGFGSAQLFGGPLSDSFGRKPVLLGGLLLFILASIGCALAPTLTLLITLRFMQAIGCCTALVVSRAIIRDSFEVTEAARTISKVSSLLSFVPLFGPILGSYLQVYYGWRAVFVLHAVFGLFLLFFIGAHIVETNNNRNRDALRPQRLLKIYGGIVQRSEFWAYAIPGALGYAAIFVFISGSSYALIQVLSVPTEYFGYCYGFGITGYLSGTLACQRLLRVLKIEETLTVGMVTTVVAGVLFFLLVMIGWIHWAMVLLTMFSAMLAYGIITPCAQAGACAPFAKQTGAAAGLLGALIMLAALICGTLVGNSMDGTLVPLAYIALGIGLLSLLMIYIAPRLRSPSIVADSEHEPLIG